MAKQIDKDAQFTQFLSDVLAKVPADQRATVKAALEDPAVRTTASSYVLASAEFSRAMDEGRSELQAAREALDKELADARTKISAWQDWHAEASAQFATTNEKLSKYEEQFGSLDDTQGGKAKPKFVTIEDAQKALNERDGFAIDTSIMLADLGDDYREKFGARLNRRELIEYATKNNLRLDVAYDRFIGPKLAEKQKAETDALIAKAKEEGAREALSKHSLPTLPAADSYTPSFKGAEGGNFTSRNQGERVNAAVEDFNKLVSA